MQKFLQLPAKARLLDVGCGTGVELESFSKFGEPFGIDVEPQMIEACRTRGLQNVYCTDIENAALPEGSFDAIFCLDALEHMKDHDGALAKIQRLGKPNSWLIATVPAGAWLWSEFDEKNRHFRRYSKGMLAGLVARHGFAIEKLSYYNFFLSPLVAGARLLGKIISLPAASEHALRVPHPFINGALRAIFASEKSLLKHMNLPFGISLILFARNVSK